MYDKSSFSPICIIVKELAPMVSEVFHPGHLRSHHRAQQGEHLDGWRWQVWLGQSTTTKPSITDNGEGTQVPSRSMTALALFLLLANGKAAVIDMASIEESSIV